MVGVISKATESSATSLRQGCRLIQQAPLQTGNSELPFVLARSLRKLPQG